MDTDTDTQTQTHRHRHTDAQTQTHPLISTQTATTHIDQQLIFLTHTLNLKVVLTGLSHVFVVRNRPAAALADTPIWFADTEHVLEPDLGKRG